MRAGVSAVDGVIDQVIWSRPFGRHERRGADSGRRAESQFKLKVPSPQQSGGEGID